jgi:hypothetical protein
VGRQRTPGRDRATAGESWGVDVPTAALQGSAAQASSLTAQHSTAQHSTAQHSTAHQSAVPEVVPVWVDLVLGAPPPHRLRHPVQQADVGVLAGQHLRLVAPAVRGVAPRVLRQGESRGRRGISRLGGDLASSQASRKQEGACDGVEGCSPAQPLRPFPTHAPLSSHPTWMYMCAWPQCV